MKDANNLWKAWGLSVLVMCGACHEKKEIETFTENEKLFPVYLTTDISSISTRVAGTFFENEDKIGLFMLEQPSSLKEERHADNVCFVYDGNTWTPEHTVYFPVGENKSDFLAYYPYREAGLAAGTSSYACKVDVRQDISENYVASDFLAASLKDISPQEEAVPLTFKHKLSAICIRLNPGNVYANAQELLAANPVVTVKNVRTSIIYDMQEDTYSEPLEVKDIIPAGSFTVQQGLLAGRTAVIVPQTVEKGHILIEVKVSGKTYNFVAGEDQQYLAGKKGTCTLTFLSAAPPAVAGTISAVISDWEVGSNYEGNLEEGTSVPVEGEMYKISVPDFTSSSVYKVMDGDKQIAEICREYLKETTIDNQAIVIYSMKEGSTDLTKGTVLQVLEENAGHPLTTPVHGGTVSWDMSLNKLVYKKGASSPLTEVYIDKEGNISENPGEKESVNATVTAELLEDARNNKNYPIVKIAAQYWMGKDLAVTSLSDGAPIPQKQTESEWEAVQGIACCSYNDTEEYFYSYATVTSGKIAPEGWKIPTKEECNLMYTYIMGDCMVLKGNDWGITDEKLNLTGFSAYNTYRGYDGKFVPNAYGFWFSDNKGMVSIYGTTFDVMDVEDNQPYGYSIRCLRK